MTLPPVWRAGIACVAATIGLVAVGAVIAQPAHAETATIEIIWLMPAGATPDNVLYDQLWLPKGIASIPCGMWAQGDHYLREEAAVFTADGRLTEGEDHQSDFPIRRMGVLGWDFYYGGDCAPGVDADAVAAAAMSELAATGAEYSPLLYVPLVGVLVAAGTLLTLRARRRRADQI
jgi:hypothetical protein